MGIALYMLVSLIMGPIGILLFGGGLYSGVRRLPLYTHGRKTTATVLARRDSSDEFVVSDGTDLSQPRVMAVDRQRVRLRFTDKTGGVHTLLYPDGSQRRRRVQLSGRGVSKEYLVGDEVRLRYLPDDPLFCFIDEFGEIWMPVLVSVLSGAFVLGILIVGGIAVFA